METKAQMLKRLRQARGARLIDVCKESGVNVGTLSRLENGMEPNATHAYLLGRYYGIPMEDLWTPTIPASTN